MSQEKLLKHHARELNPRCGKHCPRTNPLVIIKVFLKVGNHNCPKMKKIKCLPFKLQVHFLFLS
jgi:hypothetical protein